MFQAFGAGVLSALLSPVVRAQTKRVARIGFLGAASAAGYANQVAAFRKGLQEFGYEEGKTLVIEYRWADGKYERLPELAAELVRSKVDLIVSHGTPGTLAAKQATSVIPIVIANIGDPVATGIVASLARPGGNITGQTYMQFELQGKRLEFLKEAAPRLNRVALLFNPDNPISRMLAEPLGTAAKSLRIGFELFAVRGLDELESAFAAMSQRGVDGVCTDDDGWILANNKLIADHAIRHRLLSMGRVEGAQVGLLIGYGENLLEMFRNAAGFVDRILKGAQPAELPIQRPSRFELAINLKTAKAIGLTIPHSLLARANRVIK